MSREVRRVLLGVALSAVGAGLSMPLLIVYLTQVRDIPTSTAGFVVAYMAIVGLVLLPLSGIAVDRFGPRPMLMGGLVVEAIGVLLITQVTNAGSAFAVATVIALGGSFIWGPQSALIGRLTTPETRQRVFGIQFMLLNLGIGIGGIISATIVDVDRPESFSILYVGDALTYAAYVIVLFTLPGVGVGRVAHEEHHDSVGGYREVLRDRTLIRIAVLGFVLLTCGYGSLEIGLPVFVTIVNGLSVSWVAIAFTVNTMTIVAMQLVILRLITGRSRSYVLVLVAVLWGASWVVLGVTQALPALAAGLAICVSTAIFAIGETMWSPIAPSLVNDLAPEHLRGRYNSVQGLVWGVSGATGPALAGLMLGMGLETAWIGVVTLGCVIAGYLALRLRHRLTPALDGRVPAVSPDGTMTP